MVQIFFLTRSDASMARRMFRNRRRLGGGGGSYASTMGLRPVPFTRKRKFGGPSTGMSAVPRLGRRVRPRMARSYLLTKTKRKRPGKVRSHGDNSSASVNSIGKKFLTFFDKMMYRKIVSPQTLFYNSANSTSSTQGRQRVQVFPYMQSTVLTAIKTACNGGTATDIPVKFFLKSGKYSLKFKNQSNHVVKMSIYDIVTKKNTISSSIDSPDEAWQKGLTDFGGLSSGTVGFTPYKSPEFNQYFGVNRVTTLSMEAGQQHEHLVYHRYNRVVDSVQFENATGTAIAGLTRFIMLVFHGSLGHESTSAANVTYMPATIDYASSYDYTYGFIEKTVRGFTATDNNLTTVVDFDFMGEGGDADTNLITA